MGGRRRPGPAAGPRAAQPRRHVDRHPDDRRHRRDQLRRDGCTPDAVPRRRSTRGRHRAALPAQPDRAGIVHAERDDAGAQRPRGLALRRCARRGRPDVGGRRSARRQRQRRCRCCPLVRLLDRFAAAVDRQHRRRRAVRHRRRRHPGRHLGRRAAQQHHGTRRRHRLPLRPRRRPARLVPGGRRRREPPLRVLDRRRLRSGRRRRRGMVRRHRRRRRRRIGHALRRFHRVRQRSRHRR